jgi:hypothetical protein
MCLTLDTLNNQHHDKPHPYNKYTLNSRSALIAGWEKQDIEQTIKTKVKLFNFIPSKYEIHPNGV